MPGIGEVMLGAIQQAPHCDLHSMPELLRDASAFAKPAADQAGPGKEKGRAAHVRPALKLIQQREP
jgi:hypothetical protein